MMTFKEICVLEEEVEILRMRACLYHLGAKGDKGTLQNWWYGCKGLKADLIAVLRRRDIFSEAYPECSRCLYGLLMGETE